MKHLKKNMQLAFCMKKTRRDRLIASYENSNETKYSRMDQDKLVEDSL